MPKVVDIFDRHEVVAAPAGRAHPEVVRWAEGLLEKAKNGDIDCFVVVAGCPDGSIIYTHAGEVEKAQIVGGLSTYQHRINDRITRRW